MATAPASEVEERGVGAGGAAGSSSLGRGDREEGVVGPDASVGGD